MSVRRRLAALLLVLVAVVGGITAPPAAADEPKPDRGIISYGIDAACELTTGPVIGAIVDGIAGEDICEKIGDKGEEKIKEAWKAVWDSVIGDMIKSGVDVAKWVLKKTLTVALMGPSLHLEDTGLFGQDATLAGMLVWLGLVIAAFGLMWQIGKMAVTGQSKYIGQAMLGWVQHTLLASIGLTIVATLLSAGDAMTTGIVDRVFAEDGALERIVAVMLPAGIANPITLAGVVFVLLLVGFLQLVLIFLRQSAIPIQCLLLPIAGGGRTGGESTRKWAPRLINSILVVITYKPILAVIICAGFSEFGQSKTFAEWLRGLATLVLAVLAPAPLAKLFAPISEEMGAGLASGGVGGALGGAAAYIGEKVGSRDKGGSQDSGGDAAPTSAVEHARYVEQSMGRQRDGKDSKTGAGGDAMAQAARNDAAAAQTRAGLDTGVGAAGSAGATGATGAAGTAGVAGSAGAAAGPAGLSLQVLDGVNDALQKGANEMGGGNT